MPEEDVASVEARGKAEDRKVTFGRRPALLVVDMTRAFVEEAYPTSCAQWGGSVATAQCVGVLEAARRYSSPVFFTRLLDNGAGLNARAAEQGRSGMDHPDLLDTPAGLPDGNAIAGQLTPRDDEIVFGKPKASAFFGTPLDAYLMYYSVDTVVVIGMVTSGCVRATVVDAYMRNLHVLVPHPCVADYSWFQHRAALFDMHFKYADVCEVADVEQCFAASAR